MPRPAAQNSVAERVRFDAQYVMPSVIATMSAKIAERELVEIGGERDHRFASVSCAGAGGASAAPGGGRSKRPS